eukprot:Partr_v1_DN28991_c0_g1_i4_m26177 putative N-alpha-acetyltransferase 30, NatC catalytic subunit
MPVEIETYSGEDQLEAIINLIENDLSEPYCIYTYRYFIHTWPKLCLLARDTGNDAIVGVVMGRLEKHRSGTMRGYIGMLAVSYDYRKQGIGSSLVEKAVELIRGDGADEIVLETELSNTGAQALYEKLGFFRDKRLEKYYLNGSDAFRLKLIL